MKINRIANFWYDVKFEYDKAYQKYLKQGFSKAAADELAILEARRYP